MKRKYIGLAVGCQNFPIVLAEQTNVTVDDTDPSILYQPPQAWQAVQCQSCLGDDLKSVTFHNGTGVTLASSSGSDDHHGGGGGSNRGKGSSDDLIHHDLASRDSRGIDTSAEFSFNGQIPNMLTIPLLVIDQVLVLFRFGRLCL